MRLAKILLAVVVSACGVSAQNISSTVKGTVHDPAGGMVPNAECALTNAATGLKTMVHSSADGSFVFLNVLAGTYNLTVHGTGFKTFELNRIEVTSSEFHPLEDIVLTVGGTTESVTVIEKAAPVQTASGERSDVVAGTALSEIAVKGRDFVSFMQTLPGVIDTSALSRDAPGRNAMSGVHINGSRDTANLMLIDGTPSMDAGNSSNPQEATMDAIAEVKVLTSAYQAEYGRNGGGLVSVVTKSGSEQLHGSAYEYYRNEELNANDFFNNATGNPRQPYRYRVTGYSIGGPVWIPKVPAIRHKVYFFFANELLGSKVLFAQKLVNTPTALERQGDFSQSFNTNGSLITIKDPRTGQPYPGNQIPASQINALGQAILKFYPLPNFTDPRPAYRYNDNYQANYSGSWPRTQETGRIDYNVSSNTQIYFRIMNDTSPLDNAWGAWVNGSVNYDLTPILWNRPSHMYGGHVTETISSTLVDEAMLQKTYNNVTISPLNAEVLDGKLMGNPAELFPHNLPFANWIPGVSFGGTPVNTIDASIAAQLPESLADDGYVFTNNLSKVWGRHQLKAGIYLERNRKLQPASKPWRGAFNFGVDSNNPFNSGNGFANALLGYFDTYQEATSWPIGNYFFWNVEWFLQDNWRVSKRLTLDYGLRFYHLPPTIDRNHSVAAMDPGLYSRANAPVLFVPALDPSGKRVAKNPISGALFPASYIGLFVPGVGDAADGSFVGGQSGYPGGLITQPWLTYGPRFGFAYDVFGNGKTAVRGGFGMYTDRVQGNEIYNTAANPPVNYTPTQYYGSLNTYTQSAGLIGPAALTEWYGRQPLPRIMNFNLGLQQQLGAWVVDASYVGMLSRHLLFTQNINPIPLYAHFNPANRDPTAASSPLPDNFLRPYIGYGNITSEQFGASANFNSFQASVRRRFSSGLQMGASYTFSKALGVAGADGDGVSSYLPARARNYGPLAFDRRQSLVFTYVYQIPNPANRLGWRPAGWALGNWELSGITTFQTGGPSTPSFSTQPSIDISGSSDGARMNLVGNPNLPRGDRTFGHEFNPAAFALPAVGTLGSMGTNVLCGPGINDWDLAATKRFKIFSESRVLSFRGEFYNAWNHTQFSSWNTSFQFNAVGQQLNPAVGQANGARPPRNVELSARFVF
jgi:hypothetical protein